MAEFPQLEITVADSRPDCQSISKDLGGKQTYYRDPTLEEQVHKLEAKVSSLEQCSADLRTKNEELERTITVSLPLPHRLMLLCIYIFSLPRI